MFKLKREQEAALRKLLLTTKRLSNDVLQECDNINSVPICKDAALCLLLVEELEKGIGLIEDRPDEGNNLNNHKLF